jgi:hypothetical protein
MHANKGIYALLLGSGISRAAEVPTGWEIQLDLIRRVARLEGEHCDPYPAEWYAVRHGEPPNYSELLGTLAKTSAERSRLLREYFEPTEEERERGVKLPTAAHRAIAELIKSGYVRVVMTTNFDRLLEQAIENVGIVPTVIASADAAQGALPLAHTPCTVIKLHGDYLDARIRNTEEELAAYPKALDRLLDRIFDEYGLIVCGWSADWDTALRGALERCRTHRFTTYWTVRNPKPPSELAQRLIDLRRAEVVPIADADAFFRQLADHVASLEELNRPHPLSAKLAQATLKRYVVEDRHRIRLHELVIEELDRVYAELTGPLQGGYGLLYHGTPTQEALTERLSIYERLTETLRALFASGCYWGGDAQHDLWVTCLERLANLPEQGGNQVWINLRRYPALLTLYAGGIAAVSANRYDTLAALLTRGRVKQHGRDDPLLLAVNSYDVLPIESAKLIPGKENHYLPFNDYLYENAALWEPLAELLPMQERFAESFDRFEYLLGLVHVDLRLQQNSRPWGPTGCFMWRRSEQASDPVTMIAEEIAGTGDSWMPLQGGLFGGAIERVQTAKTSYDELIRDIRARRIR